MLSIPGFSAYGHWLIDLLPRLDLAAGAEVLLSQPLASWMREILERFDLPQRVIELDSHRALHCEELHVASCIKARHTIDPASAQPLWSKSEDSESLPAMVPVGHQSFGVASVSFETGGVGASPKISLRMPGARAERRLTENFGSSRSPAAL